MTECNYECFGFEEVYCNKPKGHKGKHRFVVEWETRKADISHEHNWVVAPEVYQKNAWGYEPDELPILWCSFCEEFKQSRKTERILRAMGNALFGDRKAAYKLGDEESRFLGDALE